MEKFLTQRIIFAAWFLAGKNLLGGFFLIRVQMTTMREAF
jgi:hypothetical protein